MSEGFDEAKRNLEKLKEAQFIHRGIGRVALNIQRVARRIIMSKQNWDTGTSIISDTGDLAKSIGVEEKGFGHFKIGVYSPYAAAVHEGARPHFPPFKVIYPWVRRKLKIKKKQEATRVTWAVIKSIGKRGIKGRPFLKRVVDQEMKLDKITRILQQEFRKEAIKND